MGLNIGFKKLNPEAKLPRYALPDDACLDLFTLGSPKRVMDRNGPRLFYPTGIAVEIPRGYVGLIYPRSSITTKTGLFLGNSVGVIDAGYQGEIIVAFNVFSQSGKVYEKGDAIAQLLIQPIPRIVPIEIQEFSPSERGMGGFGSTDGQER